MCGSVDSACLLLKHPATEAHYFVQGNLQRKQEVYDLACFAPKLSPYDYGWICSLVTTATSTTAGYRRSFRIFSGAGFENAQSWPLYYFESLPSRTCESQHWACLPPLCAPSLCAMRLFRPHLCHNFSHSLSQHPSPHSALQCSSAREQLPTAFLSNLSATPRDGTHPHLQLCT